MAKPFKIFLWIVGTLVVLLVGVAIAVPMLLDPNDYKGRINAAVKDSTGRELTIAGDIELHVFPWLAVAVGNTQLSNAPGFGAEPMIEFRQIEASIKLLPLLFDRRFEIGTLKADGLTARLSKNKDGVTNWADLTKPDEEKPAPPPEQEGEFDISTVKVGGVEISDANLVYADAQANKEYRVQKLALKTGEVKVGDPIDLELSLTFDSKEPQMAADVKLNGKIVPDLQNKVYEVQKLAVDVEAKGAGVPGGKQNASLGGTVRYEQGAGKLTLSDGLLVAAGLTLHAALNGEGMQTDKPRLTGKLSTDPFSPRAIAKGMGVQLPPTTDPKVLGKASFSADYNGDFKSARLENIEMKLDDTNLSGFVAISDFATLAAEFALNVDAFDADRYLPATKEDAPKEEAAREDVNAIEIPVDAIDALNVGGTFEIGSLKVRNLKLTNVAMRVKATKGAPKTENLTAKFYGGTIAQDLRVTPGATPQYGFNAQMSQINAGPAVLDLTGKDMISGVGDVKMSVTSSGRTVGAVRQGLNGDALMTFANGAVKGFNLGESIRKGKALYRGETYTPSGQPAETDFAELKGVVRITNGVAKIEETSAKTPLFRFAGTGTVDLVKTTINYVAKPTIVETSKGQGGAELEELKGLTIPIKVAGNLMSPSVKFDWDAIIKDKAKAKIQEELGEEKAKAREKIDQKLQEFLTGKKKKPAPAPAPTQPAPSGTQPAPAEPAPSGTEPAPSSPPPEQQPSSSPSGQIEDRLITV